MTSISIVTVTLAIISVILFFSFILGWKKRPVFKRNLALRRHETEAEILQEHEEEKEKN